MLAIPSEIVTGSSKTNTTPGSPSDEPVKDVTAEILGERRAEWRDGFDTGLRQGTTRFVQSDAMASIAFELKLLRVLYAGTCEALADAQLQVRMLEMELDIRAPGWDS